MDYRAYLNHWILYKKEANPHYSHRVFARRAGYTNPSLLGQIIKGNRNLSAKLLPGFVKTMGLTGDAATYFRTLVDLDRETAPDKRAQLKAQLQARQRCKNAQPIRESQLRVYDHWYIHVIRELAARPDFQLDPTWIAARLRPAITPGEAEDALALLVDLGFLTLADGSVVQSTPILATPMKKSAPEVDQHAINMGSLGIALIAREERRGSQRFGTITSLVPLSLIPTLRAELRACEERIIDLISTTEEAGDMVVYQLNTQLFPVSEKEDYVDD